MNRVVTAKWFYFCFLLLASGGLALAQTPVGVTWKMAVLKIGGKDFSAVPFSRPVPMVNGDKFQIFIQAETDAWCYVVYQSAEGEVEVLSQGPLRSGSYLQLPSEKETYSVTPPKGTEKIYVIMSTDRQRTLERLLTNTKDSQPILDEVARIRQSTSTLAENPERPAPMGGVTRGMTVTQASQFGGLPSYVKTIRIDH